MTQLRLLFKLLIECDLFNFKLRENMVHMGGNEETKQPYSDFVREYFRDKVKKVVESDKQIGRQQDDEERNLVSEIEQQSEILTALICKQNFSGNHSNIEEVVSKMTTSDHNLSAKVILTTLQDIVLQIQLTQTRLKDLL